jgi:lipid II isoglutaminyl synthase (glutamine-hydrolysing)
LATASDLTPGRGGVRDELGTARLRLSGAAGAHDAAAAVLAAIALGLDPRGIIGAIHGATPAFGRLEEVEVGGRTVVLSLAKNPASVAQAAEAVAMRQPDGVLVGLGDRPADGRDVSWIWDAPLDALLEVAPLTLTGRRADDLALRFKYADATAGPRVPPIVEPSIERALNDSLLRVQADGTLMVLATYTTLLGIRRILERRGLVAAMPR